MKNLKANYFIILLFIFTAFSFAQNISVQELELQKLEKSYAVEKNKLDSLHDNLQKLLQNLDDLKNQNPRNTDKISNQMAETHEETRQADQQEKIVNTVGLRIKKQRLILYKKYSISIDSLSLVLQNDDDSQKSNTETHLRELTRKRALVSPALPLFSFDPQLINRINSSHSKDDLEKSIYLDYLSNALSEIDSNIAVIKNKESEVFTMIRLDEQAEDFIDELDGAQFLSSIEIENNNVESTRLTEDTFSGIDNFADGILKIYEQLGPVMNEMIETPGIANFDSLASDEYLLLLQSTEKTLKLYKKIIQEKMVVQ